MLFIIVRWELPFYLRNKINNYFSFKMLFHHKRYKNSAMGQKAPRRSKEKICQWKLAQTSTIRTGK